MVNQIPQSKKGTILVVDDTRPNVRLLATVLEEAGYAVRVAFDGKMALDSVYRERPDLILLDIMMPAPNGYEVCSQLKADELMAEIPIIFLSALNEVMDKVTAFSVGGVDYITKPFQNEEVLARVNTHLSLRRAQQQLTTKNKDLATLLANLQKTQNELIQSEKMAVLGQLVASVAHEINTPLGTIQAASGNIAQALDESIFNLPRLIQAMPDSIQAMFFTLLERATIQHNQLTTKELRQQRRQLQQALERLQVKQAAVYADILTDIGIHDDIAPFVPLLHDVDGVAMMQLIYKLARQKRNTDNINLAVMRISKIIFALKSYAQYDRTGKKHVAEVRDTMETVLLIYQNHFRRGITLRCDYEPVPSIFCYPNELNQAWTNMIHNALQAMKSQGLLQITIRKITEISPVYPSDLAYTELLTKNKCADNGPWIEVSLTDSGGGISKEIIDHIFEPFFTTKPSGEGSGLGLDSVRKIVEKHDGYIEVESQPGQTSFRVYLPILTRHDL